MGVKYIINHLNKNKTRKDFEADLTSISKIIEGKSIDDLSIDEMNRLVFLHERCAISYRRLLEHLEKNEEKFSAFHKKGCGICNSGQAHYNRNLPVSTKIISVNGHDLIHIYTPFLFKKGLSESFLLAQYLNLSIRSYDEIKEKITGMFKEQKVIVHIIRCAVKFNPKVHCDNDNLETSELINVLFSNLMISDSPLRASFMSDFILVDGADEEGMHIILAPYSLDIYGEKLLKKVKEKA